MSMIAIENEVDVRRCSRTSDDWHLTRVLARENIVEELGAISLQDRLTCRLHESWVHQCITLPHHMFRVTGNRWCRRCESTAAVTVDESHATAAVRCSGCGKPPNGLFGRQIARACQASIVEWRRRLEDD